MGSMEVLPRLCINFLARSSSPIICSTSYEKNEINEKSPRSLPFTACVPPLHRPAAGLPLLPAGEVVLQQKPECPTDPFGRMIAIEEIHDFASSHSIGASTQQKHQFV